MAEKGGVWYLKLGSRTYRDEKLKAIREETGSTDFFEIWIAFLCLAVCEKRDGSLYISDKKPYTPRLLANEIGFSQERMEEAIKIFQEYDMITVKKGVIWLNNWNKYQNVKTAEEYKAKDAERSKKYRDKKKAEKLAAQAQSPHESVDDTGSEWYAPGEAQQIQQDHNELLDLAEDIRLTASERDRTRLIDLYTRYGKEVLVYAMNQAADHKKVSLAYVEAVCRDYGKPKPDKKTEEKDEYYRDESIEDWN